MTIRQICRIIPENARERNRTNHTPPGAFASTFRTDGVLPFSAPRPPRRRGGPFPGASGGRPPAPRPFVGLYRRPPVRLRLETPRRRHRRLDALQQLSHFATLVVPGGRPEGNPGAGPRHPLLYGVPDGGGRHLEAPRFPHPHPLPAGRRDRPAGHVLRRAGQTVRVPEKPRPRHAGVRGDGARGDPRADRRCGRGNGRPRGEIGPLRPREGQCGRGAAVDARGRRARRREFLPRPGPEPTTEEFPWDATTTPSR